MSAESGRAEATTPDRARQQLERLAERFASNLDAYKRAEYKEARVRVEFIDPFFEALGWDVRNVQGYAEQYKDVVHEDAIKVSGATRAPDYCFRVGGVPKFFLEAKKPAVPVKGDVGPAYQLRRYAWSAKLPLSILTDFEEFAVYDCRQRPKPSDKVSVGRIMYLTFDQYLDRFHDIYDVFGKESVLKGSFDRYVLDTRRKRGTSEVDVEFLKEIEGWRDTLARNIALRNRALSVHELNFAVQRTIDRIIFLRMCEDRGIEDYGGLLALTGGPQIYPRLGELYRQADEKYNSELFDFQADTLTRSLALDDKVLKPILSGLYYPECPYEFSVLPPEILGQVYEQFLGKVIRLTPAHRAKVEDKPEVKKAGGVYYTPTYIVEYIVQQTVGKLVEGKTPRQITKQRVLDPACGSGSFLLGAYQYLLDYHRQWYEDHDPARHARAKRPVLYQGPGGEWRLTTGEKKRILLNNIYGVDIDRQAVEVTKLSLLLKVLEGENQETLGQQLALWRERALPDLGDNVKCGNSLIGPDYFEGQLLPDEEEMRRVNPFDWDGEFPEIMAAGGFDAVIGNPPWVFTREADFALETKRYIQHNYLRSLEGSQTGRAKQSGKINLFAIFILQSLRLLKQGGVLGYIVPNNVLRATVYDVVRKHILDTSRVATIVDLGPGVIERVTASTIVVILKKGRAEPNHLARVVEDFDSTHVGSIKYVPQRTFLGNTSFVFSIHASEAASTVLAKVESSCVRLGHICIIHAGGIATGPGKRSYIADHRLSDLYKPLIEGKDVERYLVAFRNRFLLYDRDKLYRPRDESIFLSSEKLVTRRIAGGRNALVVAYDDQQYYTFNSTNTILPQPDTQWSLKYILGLLNSRFLNWYYIIRYTNRSTLTVNISKTFVEQLPIPRIDFDDPEDVARHDKMVGLVERMLKLHKKLAAATIPADKELYQRQIDATDSEIDTLVYELYGLTEEEIAIVEERDH